MYDFYTWEINIILDCETCKIWVFGFLTRADTATIQVKHSNVTVSAWLWLLWRRKQSRTVDQRRYFRPRWFCSVICCDEETVRGFFCCRIVDLNAWLASHTHLVMLQPSRRERNLFSSPMIHCWPQMRPIRSIVVCCQNTNGLKEGGKSPASSSRYAFGLEPRRKRRILKCRLWLRLLSIINHHADMFALTHTGSASKLVLHLDRCMCSRLQRSVWRAILGTV